MSKFFSGVPEVRFEGAKSKNPFAFKHYNPDEVVGGKPMRSQLKFALSWWHTLCGGGADPFGSATIDRSYGQTDPLKSAKAKADAGFEFMQKLSIDYFCFHDADLAPEGNSLAEFKDNLAEMTKYVKDKMQSSGTKLLWGTANCFSNPKFMHGAGTNPDPVVFASACAQIKNAIDSTISLGGNGYVFWGGREGYETLLNTNLGLELDNMGRLLKMARDYARSKGFKGDFYIEPKPKEPTKHQYDFDSATVIGFLRQHGLDKDFKLNIEANHATLAGHTFEHELRLARESGFFGSIDANTGDPNLGWDTDQFPTDVKSAVLCMYEVLKAGGFTNGGLNFDAKVRRGSFTPEDIAYAYIGAMDTFALGLKLALRLIEDGRIDRALEQRYAGWTSGIGASIISGAESLESLEKFALQNNPVRVSGRQELLENILNEVIYNN